MVTMDPMESFNLAKIQSKTTWKALRVGFLSCAVAALTFACGGLAFFVLTFFVRSAAERGVVTWGGMDSLISLATFSLLVGGLTFAFIDYVQNEVQRKLESAQACFNIYKEVYDRLMDPKDLEARRWIIDNVPTLKEIGNDKEKWLKCVSEQIDHVPKGWQGDRAPGKEYLKKVLNTFDFIGFVAEHYWSMENELVEWMSPSIVKVWERIEGYVEDEADRRDEKDYYEPARKFGKRCVEWRQSHGLSSRKIENAT